MRIIVKNLPNFVTKNEIVTEFNKHGEISDVHMLLDVNGKFRRVCFIGYSTQESAKDAIRYRNNTYFLNHKIKCELADTFINKDVHDSEERMIRYSGKIFIKYLPLNVDVEEIKKEFSKHGDIKNIEFIETKKHRNSIVLYKSSEDALKVYKNVNELFGKIISINCYKEHSSKNNLEYYNSLFFNFESVVKKTCENEKINKTDLVDMKDNDLGSKIALIETSLVNQTNAFLLKNNIDLKRLTEKKSKTLLIIRNMDIESCLNHMKVKARIDIAPSKTLALLKFKDEEDAYNCYKNLNLRRYNDSVIYCEFAPVSDILHKEEKDKKEILEKVDVEKKYKTNKLLVKNLPFQASVKDIEKIFGKKYKVLSIRIPKKRDGTSRGFCFVMFDSKSTLDNAIEYFGKSTHLYGRRLVLEAAKE